jgi:hypothetical protein
LEVLRPAAKAGSHEFSVVPASGYKTSVYQLLLNSETFTHSCFMAILVLDERFEVSRRWIHIVVLWVVTPCTDVVG